MFFIRFTLLVGWLFLMLIGCGYKGDLYLPNKDESKTEQNTTSESSAE